MSAPVLQYARNHWRVTMPALYRLTRIHGSLDDSIASEMEKKSPDSFRLLRLKKMRLMVKDRLQLLMTGRMAP